MYRMLVVLALGALLAGCTTVSRPIERTHLFDDGAFAAPSIRIDASNVFAMSPAMQRFFEAEMLPLVRAKGPQRGLVEALYSAQKLRLDYDATFTRTAAEAFDARAGNCLSLVMMTAAFAKRLGLEVRFQRVDTEDFWVRDADLVQVVKHINLALGRPGSPSHRTRSPSDWLTVDFVPIDDAQRYRVRTVQEATVTAMYMNNKGAEALAGGRTSDAYWWSRASIEQDPGFASAYITLAVALHRRGRVDLAQAALAFALRLEPTNPQALNNQVGVLLALGREDEARAIAAVLERLQPSTPLTAYKSGLAALKSGDYSRARVAFREALGAAPGDHEFHYMLAVAYLKLGDDALALDHFRSALVNSPNGQRRAAYASKVHTLENARKSPGVDATIR